MTNQSPLIKSLVDGAIAAHVDLTDTDRIELEQYRAIFASLSTALTNAASVHLYRAGADGNFGARVIEDDGSFDETIHSVTGATLRDAMAQAAQVVQ